MIPNDRKVPNSLQAIGPKPIPAVHRQATISLFAGGSSTTPTTHCKARETEGVQGFLGCCEGT